MDVTHCFFFIIYHSLLFSHWQRRSIFGQGGWENIPGFRNVKGDGSVKSFLETPDGRNFFYRGVIINRLNP